MVDKKYYWLKLPRNFFDKHYVKMLMAKQNGVNLTLFYIRLLTESIDHEGKLRYSEAMPYNNASLAEITGFTLDFVDMAMTVLAEMELIVTDHDGTIVLPKAIKMIGSESESAERVRRFRKKQKKEPDDSKQSDQTKKTEKKEKKEKAKQPRPEFKEIIDYFNEKAGTKYKHSTKSTQTAINARLNEGFSIDDFKLVIDVKVRKWLNDPKMRDYLRPETLFAASHFESYLNESRLQEGTNNKFSGVSERLAKEADAKLSDFVDNGEFS